MIRKRYICFLLISVLSCHKEKPVNPCDGKTRTVASFKVEESSDFVDPAYFNYETDTICTSNATFTATCEADSVIWKIGAGIYRQKSQIINFGGIDSLNLPVTLIVFRKPQFECFSNDKSSDTLTRMIYIAPSATKMLGTFQGYWTNLPVDTFSIKMLLDTAFTSSSDGPLLLINSDKSGCSKNVRATIGYKKIWMNSSTSDCSYAVNASGFGKALIIDNNNTVEIDYGTATNINSNFTVTQHKFIGRKIH